MSPFVSIGAALLLVVCSVSSARAQEAPQVFSGRAQGVSQASQEPVTNRADHPAWEGPSDEAPVTPAPKYLGSQDIVVSWSEKGDAIWAFSKSIGKWTRQEIQPAAEDGLFPLLGDNVAGLQVGDKVYAYSAQTGRWDVLHLPVDRGHRMTVDQDMVLVTDGQNVYTFAGSTGRWSSPGAAETETSDSGKSGGKVTSMFYLKHAEALSASDILRQLFSGLAIATDQRLNAIIASGSQEDLSELEAVLKKLDEPNGKQSSGAYSTNGERVYRYGPAPEGAGVDRPLETAGLRADYDQLERRAARLAEQYRDLPEKPKRGAGDAEALKGQLAAVVNKAFEARQRLQRAELDALRRRLARIEQQIEARQRIQDAIVDRRVEELLNPHLAWKPESGDAPAEQPTPEPVPQTRWHPPITPTGQIEIKLTVFDATELAQKQLGIEGRPAHQGLWNCWRAPRDFPEKLRALAKDGETTILAEPRLAMTLGQLASFALPDRSDEVQIRVTPSGPDAFIGEIARPARPSGDNAGQAGPGTPSPLVFIFRVCFRARYAQPTVVGPWVCPTEGRLTFACLTVTPHVPLRPPRPLLPEAGLGLPGG